MEQLTGDLKVTGEALHCSARADRAVQEETQGQTKWCKVADDSVVVMKSRPEKAGNRLEEKTGMILDHFEEAMESQKPLWSVKGGSSFQGNRNEKGHKADTSRPTGRGTFQWRTVTGDLRKQAVHRSNRGRKRTLPARDRRRRTPGEESEAEVEPDK